MGGSEGKKGTESVLVNFYSLKKYIFGIYVDLKFYYSLIDWTSGEYGSLQQESQE